MIHLVLVCHPGYIDRLLACMQSLDAAASVAPPLGSKILSLDSVTELPIKIQRHVAANGWRVISGEFGCPSLARNHALEYINRPGWVVFWDADNICRINYLKVVSEQAAKAGKSVGILYPQIHLQDRGTFPRSSLHTVPPIDTASAWRVDALHHAGKWRTDKGRVEDFELSWRITQLGWRAQVLPIVFEQALHPDQRRHTWRQSIPEALWEFQEIGIVALLGDDERITARWLEAVEKQELPPHCGITVVTNNPRVLSEALAPKFQRLTLIRSEPYERPADFYELHDKVGRLYSKAIKATPEAYILTWEHDVIPHSEQALKELAFKLLPRSTRAAIAACYECRNAPGFVNASFNLNAEGWGLNTSRRMSEMKDVVMNVGMVPGGFTLWRRRALELEPILGSTREPKLGWDGNVCSRMRERGLTFALHGGVKCDHLYNV